MLFQSALTVALAPVTSSITIWSRSRPSTFLKLPIATILVLSGVTTRSVTPTGALAPPPVQLWLTLTVLVTSVVRAPVVALRLASPPRFWPPTFVKVPPMTSWLPIRSTLLTTPLMNGTLNEPIRSPVAVSSSARLLDFAPSTVAKLPATKTEPETGPGVRAMTSPSSTGSNAVDNP